MLGGIWAMAVCLFHSSYCCWKSNICIVQNWTPVRIALCISSVFSPFPATLVKRELLTPLGNTFLGPGGGNQKWAKMEAQNGSEMLGVHLGGAAHARARVCMVHVCVCTHTCARERLTAAGELVLIPPCSPCHGMASLPLPAHIWNYFGKNQPKRGF